MIHWIAVTILVYGLSMLVRRWYGRPFQRWHAHLIGPFAGAVGAVLFVISYVGFGTVMQAFDVPVLFDPNRFARGIGMGFLLGWFAAVNALQKESTWREVRKANDDADTQTLNTA